MEDGANRQQAEVSDLSRMNKGCLSFTASLQEGFRYVKAFFVGQVINPLSWLSCVNFLVSNTLSFFLFDQIINVLNLVPEVIVDHLNHVT